MPSATTWTTVNSTGQTFTGNFTLAGAGQPIVRITTNSAQGPTLCWIQIYDTTSTATVSFDWGYDGAPANPPDVKINRGDAIGANLPGSHIRPGHKFTGWLLPDGTLVTAETTFSLNNTKLTAAYEIIPITSLAIDAPTAITVARGGTYRFNVKVNENAYINDLVWTVNNTAYATVNPDGSVTIRNLTGSVMLTVTDPASGLSHNIMLRIM